MTTATVQAIMDNMRTNPHFVPPTGEHRLGQWAYHRGFAAFDMPTADMLAGWNAAYDDDTAGCAAYMAAMQQEGQPADLALEVVSDHYAH